MAFEKRKYPKDKKAFYQQLYKESQALTEGIPHLISNLSNLSALLKNALKETNWVGFYLIPTHFPEYFPLEKIKDSKERLVVGPFQGHPACIEIPVGRGVCGMAVEKEEVLLVEDVHGFPGHIACDGASNSEIVLPIHNREGQVAAVLDIDSPMLSRFDEEDKEGLLKIVRVIEELF